MAIAMAMAAGGAACTSAIVAQSSSTHPAVIESAAPTEPISALTATAGQPGPSDAAERAGNQPGGTVQELQRRMRAQELTELRTTYNGAYGASLLFAHSDLIYYAALFQQAELWRVIKTPSEPAAERAYAHFVQQTRSLADLELQRVRLDAKKGLDEREVAAREDKLRGLRADFEIQRQQYAQTQERQQAARMEAEALDAERRNTRARLDELQRQIQLLEAQINAPLEEARGR